MKSRSAYRGIYDDIRDSRRSAQIGALMGIDLGKRTRSINLPTAWTRTQSSLQTVYRRDIDGGRQTICSVGWDAERNSHTWELTTDWHDHRGRETASFEALGAAMTAACEIAGGDE